MDTKTQAGRGGWMDPKPGMTAVRRVNAALKHYGRDERLTYNSSRDYYYFIGGDALLWRGSAVDVSRYTGEAMDTGAWLEAFDNLAGKVLR